MIDLSGLRVVELPSRFRAVRLAGMELAAAGADVVLVEPAELDPARSTPPLVDGLGLDFALTSAGKRAVRTRPGRWEADAKTLAVRADVALVGADSARGLIRALSRRAVVGVAAGVGDKKLGGEILAQAAAGYPGYIGTGDERPRRVPADIGETAVALLLVQGVLACIYSGRRHELVEVSLLNALCLIKTVIWAARTDPDEWTGLHLTATYRPPERGWRSADGRVTLDFRAASREQWWSFIEALGLKDEAERLQLSEDWQASLGNGDLVNKYREFYESALQRMTSAQIREVTTRHGGMSVQYQGYSAVVVHPQVAAIHGLHPGVEHGDRVLTRVRPVLTGGREGPSKVPVTFYGSDVWKDERAPALRGARTTDPPLAGVRVLDLTGAGVGPFATTLLARLGAEVVKIEPPQGDFILGTPPFMNGHNTTYAACNVDKRAVRLDLRVETDRIAVARLAEDADVLVENFRPGVMARLGLDPDALLRTNPQLLCLSMSGYGDAGPMTADRCTDPHMQAFSGYAYAIGAGEPEAFRYLASMDLMAGLVGATIVVAALASRARTGMGGRLSTSMLHSALVVQSRAIGEQLALGRALPPDGVFVSCLDGWIALDLEGGAGFGALCAAFERADLVTDHRFADAEKRRVNSDELSRELQAVAKRYPRARWIAMMRRYGAMAVRLFTDEEVLDSALVRESRAVERVRAQWGGEIDLGISPWQMGFGPIGAPHSALDGSATDEHLASVLRAGTHDWSARSLRSDVRSLGLDEVDPSKSADVLNAEGAKAR